MTPPRCADLRLVLALALLAPAAAAGERLLGAPVYDHATEATYRQVTWDDFQGDGVAPPGWNRWQKGTSYAHIATAIQAGRFEVTVREEEGGFVAVPVGIRPYAILNKDFSAVKHGSRNAATLAHEQLHFDIAELMARRLAVRLIPIEGRGATPEEAGEALTRRLRETFDAGLAEAGEMQQRYDGETAHGARKKQQKKWAEEVPVMFREATEALAAALATARPGAG